MEFDPRNHVIKLCIQGMSMEETGNDEEAGRLFLQAWNEATNDFEKFTAAYYVARHQKTAEDKLRWVETTLNLALNINNATVKGSYSSLYLKLANCYEDAGDPGNAKKYHELSISFRDKLFDNGPFYHGTRADLQVGDLLTAGFRSNYNSGVIMNHIYFTAMVNGAGLAAALAKANGRERVYIVEPTGSFENDPNVTDKKFPGNPTRSYRSQSALKIVGEIMDWERQTPEELEKWHRKLKNIKKAEIIN